MTFAGDATPDYESYTITELEEVIAVIDKNAFPERFALASAVLTEKRKAQGNSDSADTDEPAEPRLRWTEKHLTSRIFDVVFCIILLSTSLAFYLRNFVVTRWWNEISSIPFLLTTATMLALFFTSLSLDKKLKRQLMSSNKGKFSLAFIPFLLLLLAWSFSEFALPHALHNLVSNQEVQYSMYFQKASGRKRCRNRVKLIETKVLDDGELCLSSSLYDSLPETGKVTVSGKQSNFGLSIERFKF